MTLEEASLKESYFIKLFNTTDDRYGYNLESGGIHHNTACETKEILSFKAKQRYKNKENNPMYGKNHSKESLKIMSSIKMGDKNPMFGKRWNDKQRQNCGTKGKKLNLSEEQRIILSLRGKVNGKKNAKRVFCFEDNLYFDSATIAAEHYGVTVSTLCGHLNNRQKTCKNKHFKYCG